MKICTKCNKKLRLSNFYISSGGKYRSWCKKCCKIANQNYRPKTIKIKTKKCVKCKTRKQINKFYRSSRSKDGHNNKCKDCTKKTQIKYKIDANVKYKVCNKCKKKRSIINFYLSYKSKDGYNTKCKVCYHISYINNKTKIINRVNTWRKNNKNKFLINSTNQVNRRRARKLSLSENFSSKDRRFILNLFNHSCIKCTSNKSPTVDHLYPLSKGNPLSIGNAVVLCRSCNSSKGTKDPKEFFSTKELNKTNIV